MSGLLKDPIPVESEFQLSPPGPTDPFWYEPLGGMSATGQRITSESSLRVAAVMACVRVISEAVASLPLFVYRQRDDGGKEKATDHPLYLMLHTRRGMPNRWQTSQEFREMLQAHVLLRGNAYAEIRGFGSRVDELVPIHPDCVTVEQLENSRLRYKVQEDGRERILTQDRVFHLRGLSPDGICGLNPIQYAATAVGLAVSTEQHGANLFRNGTKVGGVLEHPGKLSPEAATQLRADWESLHRGPHNAHRTAVLEGGMKYHEMGMTSEDAQFLESRQFQVIEICRIFRVPPHMVYDLARATFSNIEHQGLEFVKFTLMPWLTRWEAGITKSLIVDDDQYFAEHNVDGLQRADTQTRFASYATGKQWGWLNTNEIRSFENMNPVEGGDIYLQPMNMSEAGAPPEPDESEPPMLPDERARAVFARDAAERIANTEIRELSKRIDKSSEDRERWNAWVAEMFAKHQGYVAQVLDPIVAAFGGEQEEIAERICAAGFRLVACSCPNATLEEWRQSRKSEIESIIKKALP